jgi:hypothetical protein
MNKRKKGFLYATIFAVAAVLVAWFAYNGGTYTTILTADKVQQYVDEGLQRRQNAGDKTIHIDSARVGFANNEIQISATVWGVVKNRVVKATIKSTGTVEYKSGGFYFHPTAPIRFEDVLVEKAGGEKRAFQRTRELVAQKLQQFAAEHGWEGVTQAFKSDFDEWANKKAQALITTVLTTHPVYTLKNDRTGFVVSAVLKKVEVVNDTLHITLSLAQLGYSIFIGVLLLVLAVLLVVAALYAPELFLLALLPF